MRRLVRRTLTLSATGLLAGLAIAVLGVPYGRWNPAALAELYHGTTDTTGTVHVALDCDVFTPGTQSQCSFSGNFDMAVTVGNSTGAAAQFDVFEFKVTNNRQDLLDPAIGADADLNGNPDFNNVIAPTGWTCGAPFIPSSPDRDQDPNPTVSLSFLACFDDQSTGFDPVPLPAGPDHLKLATVHYNGVGPASPEQLVTFTLSDVAIYDTTATEIELMSCEPVITVAGPCFGATVTWAPGPPDQDGDGVPDSSDNCPADYNPAQTNTDRNFISNAPIYGVDDTTRARSDNMGDACDDDDDNDGRLTLDEVFGSINCISISTIYNSDYLVFDTDGDRVFDGAECTFFTNPMDPGSKPLPVVCGLSTSDADNDGLSERIERCGHNTDPLVADTDSDGVKDGCEAASLNNDTVVNPADQGLMAAEIMRAVPASAKLANFDISKDGAYNPADQGLVASRVGKCP